MRSSANHWVMKREGRGEQEWVDNTTAFDRVWGIASALSTPRKVSEIASEAAVAENTARKHLERLVEMHLLLKSTQNGVSVYSPDPLYTRMRSLRDLFDEHDLAGLIRLKENLQYQIEDWQREFEVETLDELRAEAAESDSASQTREIGEAVGEWDLVRYRLGILNEAIQHYEEFSRDSPTD